jgi:hypothetical protein
MGSIVLVITIIAAFFLEKEHNGINNMQTRWFNTAW